MTPEELRERIDTVVIVMMENRSFDHVLGHVCLADHGGRTDVEGLATLDAASYANLSRNGTAVLPFLASDDDPLVGDLPHERDYVKQQIARTGDAFGMNGFVLAYEYSTEKSGVSKPPPMRILTPEYVPVTSFFAREFAVCDHWFAPLPASTQPNRLMALSGETVHATTVNGLLPDQDTFFDWLSAPPRKIPWRVYSAGLSFFTLMPKMWEPLLTDKFKTLASLANDFCREPDATFPRVIFVEPDYDDSPVHMSGHACDNHPPLPVSFGENFLRTVYQAVTANPERWKKTLMIVTYDEHGGFWDHVPPPLVPYAPPPGANYEEGFTSAGVRVPAFLISPLVERGSVVKDTFDHTSILQLLAERFGDGAPYSATVAGRAAAGIRSVTSALRDGARAAPDAPSEPIGHDVAHGLSSVRAAETDAQKTFARAVEQFTENQGHDVVVKKFAEIGHWLATR